MKAFSFAIATKRLWRSASVSFGVDADLGTDADFGVDGDLRGMPSSIASKRGGASLPFPAMQRQF
jgi:hypothetical protein